MTDTLDHTVLSDTGPFHIREATIADAEKIVDYLAVILKDPYSSVADFDEMMLNVHRQREHLRRTQSGAKGYALIAVAGSEIIGFLTMEPGRRRKIAHTVEIGMSVREDWRGKGVGLALIEHAVEWARRSSDFVKIVLNVFSGNEAAIRLYEKAGFLIEGRLERQVLLPDGYQDLVLMAKFLNDPIDVL